MAGTNKDNRRRATRYEINIHAEIIVDIFHVQGITQDLNNEGALIELKGKVPPPDVIGEPARLFLEDGNNILEFACEIRHITDFFLGLHIYHEDLKTAVKLRELIQKYGNA